MDKTFLIKKNTFQVIAGSVKDKAIFVTDPKGSIVSWNAGAEYINGFTSEEIIGKNFSILYTAEDVKSGKPAADIARAVQQEYFEEEGWRVSKDGTSYWAGNFYSVVKDAADKVTGIVVYTEDLNNLLHTEEDIKLINKQLEEQLQKSRSEILDYKQALDESSIVAITNQRGIINYVNDNFCKISKYSREELIGQDHRIINSGYHDKDFIRNLWVTIANGKIWRGELKNKAKDGTYYWVDTTIVPFLNDKGKPYQYLAIRADITQRKIAEEEIHKINEDLEKTVRERTVELTHALEREKELSEMKSRFVSVASHEFRTPLSAILSSISLIEHYLSPEHKEKRQKHIDRVKSSVRNLTDILDDFLSLDKLEQGMVQPKGVPFILKELIEDTMEEMEGQFRKKHQRIVYDQDGDIEVNQDKKILRNILLNLLSNASKYSPEHKTIYTLVSLDGEIVRIDVRDEGIGIPESAQKNLFTKFFRADNAGTIQGTGLGLNIVKKYMELLSGNISFVSEENKGSTFTITFPRHID